MRPEVRVDFGARSTGDPHTVQPVVCDAAAHLPELGFPEARPAVMLAERTFWEKATSMHVYCLQRRVRGERSSRHWHDLVRLDDAGIASRALADRELARSVARHKAMFFRENDSNRQRIDYDAAVSGTSGSCRRAQRGELWPKTTPPCWPPGCCCWTTMSRSTR